MKLSTLPVLPDLHSPLASRVLALEAALEGVLAEAELSETHPELSFVATRRIAALARQSLAMLQGEDDVPLVSERRPFKRM